MNRPDHPTGRDVVMRFTCDHCHHDVTVAVLFVTVYQVPTRATGTAAAVCGNCGGQSLTAVTPAQQAQLLSAGATRRVAPNEWLDPARHAGRAPITRDDVLQFVLDFDTYHDRKGHPRG